MHRIKIFIRYFFFIFFLPFWHLERLIPRNKNIWLFGSMEGNGYADNSRAFFEYVLLYHHEITAIWMTKNRNIYKLLHVKKLRVYMLYSIKGIFYSLAAKYYITAYGSIDLNIYTCNGAKRISLWHGMPLKKLGLDGEYFRDWHRHRSLFRKAASYFLCPYYRIDNVDLSIVSSNFFKPFLSSFFANAFGKKLQLKKIVTTGLPRNDSLFRNTENQLLTSFRKKYSNCRIIFYMPTWRLKQHNDSSFSPFTRFGFDVSIFSNFLEDENIIFMFKPHPLNTDLPEFNLTDRFIYLKGSEYDDLYEFLGKIDILATDYSSVYFDFLLTNKPVILTPFDYEEYVKNSGLYFDYNTYMDGIKAYNWDDFMKIVRQKKYYIVKDKNEFNYYKDANSCERVFNVITTSFG